MKGIRSFLDQKGWTGDCDLVSFAGAARNIADPADPAHAEFALRQIGLARELHHVSHVVLMNHLDCGAYGGAKAFAASGEERARHAHDLRQARAVILEKFPDLKVTLLLAGLAENDGVTVEEIAYEEVTV